MEQSVRVFRDPGTHEVVARYAKVVVDEVVYWTPVFTSEEVEEREEARRSIVTDAHPQADGNAGT